MDDTPENLRAARSLRVMMRVVTVLTAVMVLGLLGILGLMAAKLVQPQVPVLPESIELPDGAKARTVTTGEGWVLVLTDRDEVLVFDITGALRQRVRIGD